MRIPLKQMVDLGRYMRARKKAGDKYFPLVLMLEPPDLAKNPQFRTTKYRPGSISISYPLSTNWIFICWDDGGPHRESLLVQFLRQVAS